MSRSVALRSAYADYHNFLAQLDGKSAGRWDNRTATCVKGYLADLNLWEELHGLPRGAGVCDVGCSFGAGTNELQGKFPFLRIYGINPDVPPSPNFGEKRIPIIEGTAENLTQAVASAMAHEGLPRPQVLLYRNVLHNIALAADNHHGFNTLEMFQMLVDAFGEARNVLPEKGKMLIYDSSEHGNYYDFYREIAQAFGFSVRQEQCAPIPGRICDTYLALTKEPQAIRRTIMASH